MSPDSELEKPTLESIFMMSQLHALPVSVAQLRRLHTLIRSSVQFIGTGKGWPERLSEVLRPFQNCQSELTIEGDCIAEVGQGVHPMPAGSEGTCNCYTPPLVML